MKLFTFLKFFNIKLADYLFLRKDAIIKEHHLFIQNTIEPHLLEDFFLNIKPYSTEKILIRLGGTGDGGYLVPDDLKGIKTCFSPGTFNLANFEDDLAKIYGIDIFMADFSVDAPPLENDKFHFIKKFIGFENKSNYISLENWVLEYADSDDNNLILQMDIEGGEYDVLIETNREILKRFRILVIEFHNFQSIFSSIGFTLINACFMKIKQDFEIVHIHPNNNKSLVEYENFKAPPVLEITFLRKDRISDKKETKHFPHELDSKNTPSLNDVILPECFYNTKVH